MYKKREVYFKGDFVQKDSHRYKLLKKLEHGPKRYKDLSGTQANPSPRFTSRHVKATNDGRMTELRNAGLVKRPSRGVYKLTAKGRKVLSNAKK